MDKKINTTALNIALGLPGMSSVFTTSQLLKIRIVAVVSSGLSSLVGICALYLLYIYDHRKKLFRHELIAFLIICDFIKALILLLYPIILIIDKSSYASPPMIHTLGWFTQFATEGSDFAIGFFAIHFALLIFKPNWKWRNKKSGNIEGGLYKYRHFIWPITILVPAIMASLVFVDFNVIDHIDLSTVNIVDYNNEYAKTFRPRRGGYKPWSAWSYLPARPLWYKYVLSWGPRYFLILMIISIYLSIYIYVLRETRKIKEQFHLITGSNNRNTEGPTAARSSFFRKYFVAPTGKILRVLSFIVTFNVDTSYDDASMVDSGRSYSIISSFHTRRCDGMSVGAAAENQLLQSIVSKKRNRKNKNKKYNRNGSIGKGISLESYNFIDAMEAGGGTKNNNNHNKNNHKEYTPRESVSDVTTSEQNSQDVVSIRKTITKGTESKTSDSSFSTNKNETLITENDLQQENTSANNSIENNNSTFTSTLVPNASTTGNQKVYSNDASINISNLQNQLLRENYAAMKKRRAQLQRNLKMIFIYPVSYILLWTFPIAADISQTHHEMVYGPILWLTYIDTFIRPMSCLVNSFVFIIKEKPWEYSWQKVEEKNLIDKYILKGEIGEEEMQKLCESELGRCGWYYRSMWRKKHCWKHQNNSLKRCLWYIGRFCKRIFTFQKLDFYDNCNDELYWSRYYCLDKGAGYPRTCIDSLSESNLIYNLSSSLENKDHSNDQKTIPQLNVHCIESFISPDQNLNSNPSKQELVSEVSVPWYWKLLHRLPFLNGIDLDELNRSVNLKYTNNDDDFIIPGLSFAVNSNMIVKKNTVDNIPHNKNNSSSNETKTEKLYHNRNFNRLNSSSVAYSGNNNHIATLRLNNNSIYKTSSDRLNDTQEEEEEEEEVDLFAFLNDPSMH